MDDLGKDTHIPTCCLQRDTNIAEKQEGERLSTVANELMHMIHGNSETL